MNNRTSHIRFGFLVTCLAFTFPISFLIYFMIQFKNESIHFAQSEREGTLLLNQTIEHVKKQSLSKDNFQGFIEKITDIGDKSKLILDPDLDSYYVMDLVVNIIPKTIGYVHRFNDPTTTLEEIKSTQYLIAEEVKNFERAFKIIKREDVHFYGLTPDVSSEDMQLAENIFYKEMNKALHFSSGKSTVDVEALYKSWRFMNKTMERMLSHRISQLEYEKNMAISVTVGLWICSLIFVVFFSNSIARRQNELNKKIEYQNLKLTASSKLSALGEMAGGIAHEVNTPLAAIRLNCETMIEGIQSNSLNSQDLIQMGNTLVKIVDRISVIIQSMRKLSRDASFDPRINVNLESMFSEIIPLCNESIRRKEISLQIDIPKDINLQCNAVELSQVFINLINNSMDAIETQTDKWIRIKAEAQEGLLNIRVSDSGPSIPEDVRKKMFAPFFTTKPIGSGTGLGLGISKRIIEDHLGTLALDSDAQTCFIIKLPIQLAEREEKNDQHKKSA